MSETKGIVLLSLNKPSYGKFALTMLASIKERTDLKVQLICDEFSVSHVEPYLDNFDVITIMNEIDYSTENMFDAARAKLNLYKYLTFDRSIYLDVDGILLGELDHYFDILKGEPIHIQGCSSLRPSHWATKESINKYIPINKQVRDINSSFIYIEKCEKAKDYFELCESYYSSGKIPKDALSNTWGGLKYPDELFFSIGFDSLNIYSTNDIAPVYFHNGKADVIEQMKKSNSVVMSLYGNKTLLSTEIMYKYDVYAKNALEHLGIKYIWNVKTLMNNKYVNNQKNPILLR